jgi:hypothetical protein
LVIESVDGQRQVTLAVDDVFKPLAELADVGGSGSFFLKAGRKLARIQAVSS